MTTSNDPRGRLSELYSARQTALAVPAASPDADFVNRHFYDWTPTPQSEPQEDEVMGGGFHNSVDARPAAGDTERASLRAVWPLDLVQIGFVLTELFGAPVTTGSAPYVHTWTSAAVQIPTTTFERKLLAGAFDSVIGAVARSLQFPLGSDRGFTRINADYFARQVTKQYADSTAGTPEIVALAARVPRKVGTVKKDGVALGSIISGSLDLTNVLGEDSYHGGGGFIDDVQVEGRTVALNLTGRFKGAALRNLGELEVGQELPEALDFECGWELSASLKLVITIRNVRFAKTAPASSGPGRMDIPLRGRAEVGVADPMVTAVLTNARASYE